MRYRVSPDARNKLVAAATLGLDQGLSDLAPEPRDDDLDRIRVRSDIALINLLGQHAALDDGVLSQDQTFENAPFQRGQLQRKPIEFECAGLGFEAQRPADDARRPVSRRA